MSKRIGYVGLSTPIFYDRRNPATRTANDENSSPNPILDGAVGAMLLYDELWFLCRSLCPENMRNLRFVRFLDEEEDLPSLDCEQWEIDAFWSGFEGDAKEKWNRYSVNFEEPRRLLGLSDGEIYTATNNLRIGDFLTRGTSRNYAKLFLDVRAVAQLPSNVELVTNRISSILLDAQSRASSLSTTADSVILRNVPEYLDAAGPYHPFVEELRESRLLSDFRVWLTRFDQAQPVRDVSEMRAEIDAKIAESMREAFLKSLDPRNLYRTTAETVVGALVPIVGTASSITSVLRSYSEEKQASLKRWQGFLVEAEVKALSRTGRTPSAGAGR